MTDRERWVRCTHFQSVDHIPDEEFGYWDENFKVWQEQGFRKMSMTIPPRIGILAFLLAAGFR